MPRLVYLAGWALLAVAGAFLLTDWLTLHPGPTERNARRIREGMTRARVEAILGGPPGLTADSVLLIWPNPGGPSQVEHFGQWNPARSAERPLRRAPAWRTGCAQVGVWDGDEGSVCVAIDERDRVEAVRFQPGPSPGSRRFPLGG